MSYMRYVMNMIKHMRYACDESHEHMRWECLDGTDKQQVTGSTVHSNALLQHMTGYSQCELNSQWPSVSIATSQSSVQPQGLILSTAPRPDPQYSPKA